MSCSLLLLATLSLVLPAAAAETPAEASSAEASSAEDDAWDVTAAFGPTTTVDLSLDEGTWISVTEHVGQDLVVFDLLGDLWAMSRSGGAARQLTDGPAWDRQPMLSPDGRRLAFVSDRSGNQNVWILDLSDPEAEPEALTREEEARITDPVWDPSGDWMIVRRRTVDTRSIGVTELWQVHLDGGKGFALTGLDAHPHAGEAVVGPDGRFLYFSSRRGRFDYGQDPLGGLWSIQRLDRQTGEIRPVVSGVGSAARPTLSPDGTELAFISRDRTDTLLEVLDLSTGRRRVVTAVLDNDQLEGFALQGTYPRMSWTADGLLYWAGGRLHRVEPQPVGDVAEVPFQVQGSWQLHTVPRPTVERPPLVQARVLRWPVRNAAGDLALSAMGRVWVRSADGEAFEVLDAAPTGYAPAWSPDGRTLAWTSWDDETGGALHLTRDPLRRARTETLPLAGHLVNPAWDEDGDRLVVLRGVGGSVEPDAGSVGWFELVLLERDGRRWTSRVVTSVDHRGANRRAPRLFLAEDRVWFLQDRSGAPREPQDGVLVSVALDGTDRRTHLHLGQAQEIVPSPDLTKVAWKLDHQAWVTALPRWGGGEVAALDALPRVQLSEDVGDWISWSPDGASVSWVEGPVLHTRAVPSLDAPEEEAGEDGGEDGGEEADGPEESGPTVETEALSLFLPAARPEGVLALTHARVVSMADREDPGP